MSRRWETYSPSLYFCLSLCDRATDSLTAVFCVVPADSPLISFHLFLFSSEGYNVVSCTQIFSSICCSAAVEHMKQHTLNGTITLELLNVWENMACVVKALVVLTLSPINPRINVSLCEMLEALSPIDHKNFKRNKHINIFSNKLWKSNPQNG